MVIQSKLKQYEVKLERDFSFLRELGQTANAQFVIDEKVYQLYKGQFSSVPSERLLLIEASEENKVIETVLAICEAMTEMPAKRNAVLISVGGGIIQDLTGFTANILYRGIKWIFVPTTLLAACDSCIGGKTSLNYKSYKNLLGTFYPPDAVHICPAFWDTLTDRDYKSGLGEVIKFNLMEGEDGLKRVSANIDSLLARKADTVGEFVLRGLAFKKEFIEQDEFDKGERIKLNFAHTFGHAIETFTAYEIPHGTAVAIGMVIADHLAVERGMLDKGFADEAQNVLMRVIDIDINLMKKPIDIVIDAMRKDKKQTADLLTAVLMTNTPKDLKIVRDVSVEEVEDGFRYFCELYEKGIKEDDVETIK